MNKYFKYFFLIVVPLLGLIISVAHYFAQPPVFDAKEEVLNFAEKKQDEKSACLSYIELLKIDSTNSKYQFLLAKEWSDIDTKELNFFKFELKKRGDSPLELYNRLSQNNNPKIRNSGLFANACLLYFKDNLLAAKKHLDSISNDNHIGLNLLNGFELLKSNIKIY